MINVDTMYDPGDTVAMVNDPDSNVGIVSGYKIMPGADVEYLVIWSPQLSSWCYDFELKKVDPPAPKMFGGV